VSTTNPQSTLYDHVDTETCNHDDCETTFAVEHAIRGNYCSAGCFYRQKGANVLARIRQDHRLCATCFRQIKTVTPPPKRAPECAIGTQHQTEHTVWGVDDVSDDPYVTLDRQRWSCECGAVDPSERDAILEDVEIEAAVPNLLRTLHFLDRSGQIDRRPSKERLFNALREAWRDWEYAIGRALYE